jgi:hypothetical protein
MQIIDAHTHCYPEELARDPRTWASIHHEPHWAELVAPLDRTSIQGWATPSEMLTAMDAAGVDQAVLLGWYWENESTCRWHNQVIAEWIQTAPDRFIGFAAIQPSGVPDSVQSQLEAAQSLGLCGVGELHPGVQGFTADSPGWRTLADWCCEQSWPVNLHATEAAGHDHPGSVPTPLNDFVQMASQHPKLKMILAHWGGGLPFFEQNPRIRKILANVAYDCSASPLLYQPEIFRRMIDLVGIEKLIFGSDYPLRIYPKTQKSADFSTYTNAIQTHAGLNPDEATALFARNIENRLP